MGEKTGEEMFKRFKVNATPTILLLGPDGSEIDWHVGYSPPPEKFQDKLDNSVKGIDTAKALAASYAKDPKNVDIVFKLAQKYDDRLNPYDPPSREKIVKLFKEVLALDPDGKKGTTDYGDKKVTFTEYAEFSLGILAYRTEKRDLEPLKAFIKKYQSSPLLRNAYSYASMYYGYSSTKEEADKFFEEYVAKYPDDPYVLSSYIQRIIRDKGPLDRGVELAKKTQEMTKYNPDPRYNKSLAELYILKGEPEKADDLYGKNFMEGRISMLGYNLLEYANFWVQQNKNTDSALAMAEMALRLNPENWYSIQSLAQIYLKLNKDDKALEVYGPGLAKKNWDKSSELARYSRFWTGQGKNLDSALEAAKRAVELAPDEAYNWDAVSQACLKLKKYDEALKAEEKAVALADASAVETYKKRIEAIKKAQAEDKK